MSTKTVALLSAETATGASTDIHQPQSPKRTFQADGTTSAGSGSATILVEVSNNNSNWETLATITLTLATTTSSDGFASEAPWRYVRGNVSAISGTDGTVNLIMGTSEI